MEEFEFEFDLALTHPLLEAVWLMRWNNDKTAMKAVLTEREACQMCNNIVKELDKAGYKIVRKD